MTTWANARCTAVGPAGEPCGLPAGHAGDHASAPIAPPVRRGEPKSNEDDYRRLVMVLLAVVALAAVAIVAYLVQQSIPHV